MADGTFKIYTTTVPSGTSAGLYSAGSNYYYLDAVDGIASPGDTSTITANFNAGKIWLDNEPNGRSLSQLPTGFTITDADVLILAQIAFNVPSGSAGYPKEITIDNFSISGIPGITSTGPFVSVISSGIGATVPITGPYSTLNFIGLNTLSFDLTNTGVNACRAVVFFGDEADYSPSSFIISGTYTTTEYQWYLERIEEEHDGIKFERDVLTQVSEGGEPPEGAVPTGAPNVDPTYVWWEWDDGTIILYLYQPFSPGVGWTEVASPTDYGWWKSYEEFLGGALLVVNGNPKKPRTFEEITDYSDFMGGFPGCGTVYNHKLVYAGRDYSQPVVRIFDGLSDRELARVPPVSGVDATAIISMTTQNGVIYLTTLDAGTTDTTFTGRVFSLDVPSASLTQIGAQFTGGEVPYAICWHNGMLWCGTNPAGDGSESGKIYSFRPDVDTVWTEDFDLATPVDLQVGAGCTGLASYRGGLVVTCTGAAGQAAPLYIRGIDYGIIPAGDEYVWWGEGLGTGALNCWGHPTVFEDTLYFTYWDSTYGASVWKWAAGDAFAQVLGPLAGTIAPLGLYLGSGNLYALFGGFEQPLRLWATENGFFWDDITDFLPGNATQKATPVFAEIRTA